MCYGAFTLGHMSECESAISSCIIHSVCFASAAVRLAYVYTVINYFMTPSQHKSL